MNPRSAVPLIAAVLLAPALAACGGSQSALSAGGPEADRILVLTWVLFIGGAIIMVATTALAVAAIYGRAPVRRWLSREAIVTAGGIVFPVVVLSALLAYGLLVLRAGGSTPDDDALHISVVGEQWWWRVVYDDGAGGTFEMANEIRVPTGTPVVLTLTTADVIHSFWVPRLAGKLDMIPGRANTLTFTASEPGISRGQCAEYCGGAHALMAFNVVAMEPADFDRWFEKESGPAEPPTGPAERQGQLVFLSSGCGGCHAVRGSAASGRVGPDLTHLASRTSLAAGILPNNPEALSRWIVDNQHIKPGNLMPPYEIFNAGELDALSSYLAGLE